MKTIISAQLKIDNNITRTKNCNAVQSPVQCSHIDVLFSELSVGYNT